MFTIANVRPFGTNIGNGAIHFALRQLLYEVFGRLVSVVDIPAHNDSGRYAEAGFSKTSVHRLNRFADGVVVGGGNLFENGALVVDDEAVQALQPPLALFSNSWGRIYNRFNELAVRSDSMPEVSLKNLLGRADISLSRDSTTHALAKSLDGRDRLGWCPTVGIGRFSHLLPELPPGEEVGALVVVRTPELMNIPYRFQNQVFGYVRTAINALRESGHSRVRVLCNDTRDLDFASAFRDDVGADSIFAGDVYEYLALLKEASLVVSFRLHATLPALAMGTPVVNVTYDERAESLLADLHADAASLNLVRDGDIFGNRLRDGIHAGGFLNSPSTDEHWEYVIGLQLEALAEFRTKVASYVRTGQY